MKRKNRNWVHKQNLKKITDEYKLAHGCKYCGESHLECLVFHHRNRYEKEHAVSALVSAGASEARLRHEMSKCDVVCHNCHAKLEAQLKAAGAVTKQKPPAILPGMWENRRRIYVKRERPDEGESPALF